MSANVKIGVSNSGFQKQMSEMARQLKVLQSQFNLTSTQAKLFGNAEEQLKAKQVELTSKMKIQNSMVEAQQKMMNKLTGDLDKQKSKRDELSKKIEETTKKYNESVKATGKNSEESKKLKEELSKLKESYSQNEKAIKSNNKRLDNAEIKMNNTKKSILENSKALDEVNKKLKDVKLDNTINKLNKVSDVTGKVSSKLMPFAAGFAGAGVAAAKFSMNLEDGMVKVSTIADETQVSIDDLRKGVLKLSSETGKSAVEMSEGLYQALSASVDTSESINFMGTATKAAVGGFTDVSTAVDGLSTVLNSYGIKANEVDKIANQMLITQNKGKTTFGELASSVGKVTPIASQLNISTQELFSSLASTTAQGLNTAESVTALKAAFSNIVKPSKEAADAAETLGINFNVSHLKSKGWIPFLKEVKEGLESADPQFKKTVQAMQSAIDKMSALESAGKKNSEEYKIANKEFKAYKKELELLAQVTDSPVSAMAKMFGSVDGLNSILMLTSESGMKIYNDTMKEMGTNTTALEDAYKKVSGTTQYTFKKAMEEGKNALIGFGDVMAPFIGLVAKGLSKITGAFNGLSEGQKKVFIGVGSVIVGFTGLFLGISKVTGAVSEAITNYRKITGLMKKWQVATKLQTVLQAGLNLVMKMNPIGWVIMGITLLVGALVLLYKKCEWFRNGVKAIGNAIVNGVKSIANKINEMKDKIVNILSKIRDKAKEIWENIKSFFTESIPNFCKWLIEQIKNIPKYLGNIVGGIIGLVVLCVKNIWNFITKTVPEIIGKIIAWFMELPGKLWNCLLKAIEKIQQWGSRTYQKATEYASKAINAIIEWFRNLPSRIWEWLSNACQKVVSWGMDLSRAAINAGKSLVNGMIDTIKNLPRKMLDIGKDIVRGLWNGIKGMGSWLWDCISDFGSGIVDGFKSVLGIHSPSRVLRDEVGKYMAQGISVGFTNEMDDVNLDIKQSLNRTINTQLKPTIDNADIDKINARLNNNTKNEIIVLVENQTVVDGEVIESKVYKRVARRLKGDENSYRAVRGKRGFGVA